MACDTVFRALLQRHITNEMTSFRKDNQTFGFNPVRASETEGEALFYRSDPGFIFAIVRERIKLILSVCSSSDVLHHLSVKCFPFHRAKNHDILAVLGQVPLHLCSKIGNGIKDCQGLTLCGMSASHCQSPFKLNGPHSGYRCFSLLQWPSSRLPEPQPVFPPGAYKGLPL